MGNRLSSPQPSSIERKTAVLLIGNSGSGKSTLLTQLGVKTFESGVKCRQDYTKNVLEEQVELECQQVVLIDVQVCMSRRPKKPISTQGSSP